MSGDQSEEAKKETTRLWRCWQTARQMCFDRGYEFTEDELQMPLESFQAQFTDELGYPDRKRLCFSARPTAAMNAKHTDPPTAKNPNPQPSCGTIWVEFNGDSNVGVRQLRTFAHHITEHNFQTGVFISSAAVTPSAMKIIPTVLPRSIEVFQEQDLLVNITRHEMVPKHILLSKDEKNKLLERYRVKESQLPRIQVGDPVARYLGLKRGQVVKIVRKSETAGRYASYRWVI